MRVSRGPFLYFLIFSIGSVLFWLGLRAAQAEIYSIVDRPDWIYEVAHPRIPGHIFIPDGETPRPTPTATPPATPEPSPEPPDTEGYQLDGNDYVAVVSPEGLALNVDGLALDKIPGYAVIHFELEPLNGAESAPLYLQVWNPEAGHYDLRFADFEKEDYRLKMKYPKNGAMAEMELKPHSRILFSANYMEAILFAGEETPAAGIRPSHYLAVEEGKTILVGANGSLVLESRPVPGAYVPPAGPTTDDEDNTGTIGTNPSTNNPPLGGGPTTPVDVPRVDAQLGGGGGLLSCSLHGGDRPTPLPPVIVMLGLGLFSLALVRLRKQTA